MDNITLLLVAAIGATTTVVVSLLNFRALHKSRTLILAETDTSNGSKLGETVHAVAQTVEIIAAQTHVMQSWMLNHDERHRSEEETP